jgi:excisionase family DNA binding protein
VVLFLSVSPELIGHLGAAVLAHCHQLRRSGLSVPVDLARLRDELHRAASSGPDSSPVADLAPAADRLTVSVVEAASCLGVSPGTVRRMAADGRLPVFRVGRRVLVPTAALAELVRGEAA